MASLLVPKVLFIAMPFVGLAVLAYAAPQFTQNLFTSLINFPQVAAAKSIAVAKTGYNAIKSLLGFSHDSNDSEPRNDGSPNDNSPKDESNKDDTASSSNIPKRFESVIPKPFVATVPVNLPTKPVQKPAKMETLAEYIQRLQGMKTTFQKHFDNRRIRITEDDEIICPISRSVMQVPVRIKGANKTVFDYASLVSMPSDDKGNRNHPLLMGQQFQLTDLLPAKDIEVVMVKRLKAFDASKRDRPKP